MLIEIPEEVIEMLFEIHVPSSTGHCVTCNIWHPCKTYRTIEPYRIVKDDKNSEMSMDEFKTWMKQGGPADEAWTGTKGKLDEVFSMTTTESPKLTEALLLINKEALKMAHLLCADTENTEYVRGCAELLIDTTPGLNMDEHKEVLMSWLRAPIDPPKPTIEVTDDMVVEFYDAHCPISHWTRAAKIKHFRNWAQQFANSRLCPAAWLPEDERYKELREAAEAWVRLIDRFGGWEEPVRLRAALQAFDDTEAEPLNHTDRIVNSIKTYGYETEAVK